MLMSPVMCMAKPNQPRKTVKPKHIKAAIEHTKNLCLNYEDTTECKMAWDDVHNLEVAYNKQQERERHIANELIWFSDLETREYDL